MPNRKIEKKHFMNSLISYPALSAREKIQFGKIATARINGCEDGCDPQGAPLDRQDIQALTMTVGFLMESNAGLAINPHTIREQYLRAHKSMFPEGNSSVARAEKNIKLLVGAYAECNPLALALLETTPSAEQQHYDDAVQKISENPKSAQTVTPYQLAGAVTRFSSGTRLMTRPGHQRSGNPAKHLSSIDRTKLSANTLNVLTHASNYLSTNLKGQNFTLEEWESLVRGQPEFSKMGDGEKGKTMRAARDIFNKALTLPASPGMRHVRASPVSAAR